MRRRVRPAEERLRRLLVMLPWLMERGTVPLEDIAARFDLTVDEVTADLELASVCGLPPYVDELIDVFIDEGTVHVGVPRLFTRPLRLDAMEAFELLAAAGAAMELPGADPDGPLGRGLAKLAAATGRSAGTAVTVELERPDIADEVASAAARGEVLDVEYWSPARDEVTRRTILPLQVLTDRGNWYVVADDDRSGAVRTFRLDRILAVTATGRIVDDPARRSADRVPPPGEWFADVDVPRAVLRLGPGARWLVERYPVDEVGEPDADGWMRVVLPVASERWFERLLVRLGPDAVVEAPEAWTGLARAAANRMLAVYRSASG